MHITVSWDIKNCDTDEWNELNDSLKKTFKNYSWVKPLSTYYIVQINDFDDRKIIRQELINLCKINKGKINVIISPIIEEGKYSGWLPSKLWEKIKKRVDEGQ